MRAVNDPQLDAAAGGIVYLVGFSIAASLLSITSKYVWVDEFMVEDNAKSFAIKSDNVDFSGDNYDETNWVFQPGRMKKTDYYLSYGYILRWIWRFAAVSARFTILALIWVVLGGRFLAIFIPTMTILWYIMLFFYGSGTRLKETCQLIGQILASLGKAWNESDCIDRFFIGLQAFFMFLAGSIGGIILQLGIGVITGNAIYRIRVIENIILMTWVTVFGFAKFDCGSVKCADEEQRYALDNLRILSWIIAGWVAVITHFIVSIFVGNMIDEDYDFNATTVAEKVQKELERIEVMTNNSREIEAKLGLKKRGYPVCKKCRLKRIPLYAKDCAYKKCILCEEYGDKQAVNFWCDNCGNSLCVPCSAYPWKADFANSTTTGIQTKAVEMETVEN